MKSPKIIRFWHILMIAVCALFVTSCDLTLVEADEDTTENKEGVISENINSLVMVDDPDLHVEVNPDIKFNEATRGISKEFNQQYLVKRDTTRLYFQGVPESEKPRVGEILIAGKYCMEYTGYMVKVTDVVDEGDMTIVTCQQAELKEAFDKLEFNASKILVSDELEEQFVRSRVTGQSSQTRWSWFENYDDEKFTVVDEKDLIVNINLPGSQILRMGFEHFKLSGTFDLKVNIDTEKKIYDVDFDVKLNPQYSFIADFDAATSSSTRNGSDVGNSFAADAKDFGVDINFSLGDITDLPFLPQPISRVLDEIARKSIYVGIPLGTTGAELDLGVVCGLKLLGVSLGGSFTGSTSSYGNLEFDLTAKSDGENVEGERDVKNKGDDGLFKFGGLSFQGSLTFTPVDFYVGVCAGGSAVGLSQVHNAIGYVVLEALDFQLGGKVDCSLMTHATNVYDYKAVFVPYGKIVLLPVIDDYVGVELSVPIYFAPKEIERAIVQNGRDISYGFEDPDDTSIQSEPGLIISDNEREVEVGF